MKMMKAVGAYAAGADGYREVISRLRLLNDDGQRCAPSLAVVSVGVERVGAGAEEAVIIQVVEEPELCSKDQSSLR